MIHQDLYAAARAALALDPAMGKKRLAVKLGVKTPTSRRLLARYRGETQGHGTDPDYVRVLQLKQQHPDWGATRLAQQLGISLDHAKVHLARWLGAQSHPASSVGGQAAAPIPSNPPQTGTEPVHAGGVLDDIVTPNARNLFYRGTTITDLDDLLVYARVDSQEWEVEKWQLTRKEPVEGELSVPASYQIRVWLKRRVVEAALKDLTQQLLAQFQQAAPVRPANPRPHGGDGMLEISIMDLHFGKLCYGEECGRDYNPDIAERMYWDALEDLLAKGNGFKPAKILLPCGNDFFNTDILGRTTTAGTPQDSAISWKEAFVRGWSLLARAIERLRAVAPVSVVVVNGNHDLQNSFMLGEVLKSHFSRTSEVTVDNSPSPRKYVTHHKCLLGLTHGSEERLTSLPLLLATDRKDDWAKSTPATREWHIGHFHSKKSLKLLPAQDIGGVLVRVVPSLCPPDAWHAANGYGGKLAAEAYYWDPECGVTATLTHSPV